MLALARHLLLAAALITAGCAGLPTTITPADVVERTHAIAELETAIAALHPSVSPREARAVAEVAIEYPLQLAREYELTTPPLWHNTLVNLGIKPRGLCIDWTRDLLVRLQTLRLRTLQLHWGVANYDAVFRIEHSTAIVSARRQPLERGIVLDPWRHSGQLFWARVTEDPAYRWRPLAAAHAWRAERAARVELRPTRQ